MTDTTLKFSYKFDGYDVAERLLEGVMFDVVIEAISLEECKVISVEVESISKDYFEQFNTEKWLQAIKDHVEDHPAWAYENLTDEEYDEIPEG